MLMFQEAGASQKGFEQPGSIQNSIMRKPQDQKSCSQSGIQTVSQYLCNLCKLFPSPPSYNPLILEVEEGNDTPLQYSCLEKPVDGGAWQAAVHGVAKSQTRLSDFTLTSHFHALEKEMANNPLQCSCLENLRDGGAWWAAVCGVAQSQTRLKRLSSSSILEVKILIRAIFIRQRDVKCLQQKLLNVCRIIDNDLF